MIIKIIMNRSHPRQLGMGRADMQIAGCEICFCILNMCVNIGQSVSHCQRKIWEAVTCAIMLTQMAHSKV